MLGRILGMQRGLCSALLATPPQGRGVRRGEGTVSLQQAQTNTVGVVEIAAVGIEAQGSDDGSPSGKALQNQGRCEDFPKLVVGQVDLK